MTLTVTDARGRTASVSHSVTAAYLPTDLAVAVGGSAPRSGQYTYTVTVRNLGTPAHSPWCCSIPWTARRRWLPSPSCPPA